MGASLIHYLYWVPAVAVLYFFNAYASINNRDIGGAKWFVLLWLTSAVPVWMLVSKYSKNLVLDVLIYNMVLLVAFLLGMMIFGQMKTFLWYHLIGLSLCVLGLFIMNIKV